MDATNVLKLERLCKELERSCRCWRASNDPFAICHLRTDGFHVLIGPTEVIPHRFGPPYKIREFWAQLGICPFAMEKQFGMRPHQCSFSLKQETAPNRGQMFPPMQSCHSFLSVQKTLVRISEEDRPDQEQKPQNLIEQRMCWVRGCGKTSSTTVIPVFFRKFLSPFVSNFSS